MYIQTFEWANTCEKKMNGFRKVATYRGRKTTLNSSDVLFFTNPKKME